MQGLSIMYPALILPAHAYRVQCKYNGHGGWNCFVCFGFPCSVMVPILGVTAMLIGRTDSNSIYQC